MKNLNADKTDKGTKIHLKPIPVLIHYLSGSYAPVNDSLGCRLYRSLYSLYSFSFPIHKVLHRLVIPNVFNRRENLIDPNLEVTELSVKPSVLFSV